MKLVECGIKSIDFETDDFYFPTNEKEYDLCAFYKIRSAYSGYDLLFCKYCFKEKRDVSVGKEYEFKNVL